MMKKIYVLLGLMLVMSASAQWRLTPNGLLDVNDDNYLELYVEEGKAAEMYEKVVAYVNENYHKPEEVMKGQPGEKLTIRTTKRYGVRRTEMDKYDISYELVLEFKEGRVKVSQPIFDLMRSEKQNQLLKIQSANARELGIWNKNGKLKSEMAKDDIERFFNDIIVGLKEALGVKDDW